jgi:hypothetical protein
VLRGRVDLTFAKAGDVDAGNVDAPNTDSASGSVDAADEDVRALVESGPDTGVDVGGGRAACKLRLSVYAAAWRHVVLRHRRVRRRADVEL